MEDKQNTYWSLLAKHFSGNASEEEQEWILAKRKQEKEFDELYLQSKSLWQKSPAFDEEYEPDVESGWQRLQLKARMRQETDVAQEEIVEPRLVAAPKRSFPWAVAASIAFLLVLGSWWALQSMETDWVEIQTADNESKMIELADGSRISLNENSSLAYPENFQTDNREVHLKGEAFFQVEKAEGKRFTVFAENTKTEVIGTAFYLRAYPTEEVKIQVTEGKVAFASIKTEEAVFLTPGQEAVVAEKAALPVKQESQNLNFQAWHSKKLIFHNTRLDQLVRQLEDYFDTSISIENPELHHCHFTVSFEDPELEEALEIISLTGNLTISNEKGQYVISGASCN